MDEKEVEYDNFGRMKYDPSYHPRQFATFTEEESAFIVRYYKRGEVKRLSLEVGRTCKSLRQHMWKLKRDGRLESLKQVDFTPFLTLLEEMDVDDDG